MDYKDFIKPNERVVYMPNWEELPWWCDYDNSIVEVGEYKPYYTDGTPETEENVYEECCMVECHPEDKKIEERQFRLRDLHPIKRADKKKIVIYNGKRRKFIGSVLSFDTDAWDWEENGYSVIEIRDSWKVVDTEDCEEERQLCDLSYEELVELRKQICAGSIYLEHYFNTFGVEAGELSDSCDEYLEYLRNEYGEENADGYDTPEEFANYFSA